ncbi:beta-ketoacyl synthase N-terminal-like domain-containing protein [Bradyrhizobium sp. SZCCHNRI2049]|uniref:beta-ketoacyl synthase N-terminal-like domain-containing protein n=1 Tax=Bradyrhizobium sp. SZCCHNRI2049 TaxID=3057287 RepID=UPI0029167BF1|nr:beta-ketoacyl synthase N-terminal-like domain-containing protein [Bradyrhizobium sp. SZCCHNRI2049]
MKNLSRPEILVTGMGAASSVGVGRAALLDALLSGRSNFSVLSRPGRQFGTSFIGAEISDIDSLASLPERQLRIMSLSTKVALAVVDEAWRDAQLSSVDPRRIGLIIGGSNLQQRELVQTYTRYARAPAFVRPSYSTTYLDTDICAVCTEYFGIQGVAFSLGAASASGLMAVIQAATLVESGVVDVCIAVGALTDISYWECIALRALGAMGEHGSFTQPSQACRPFDRMAAGFIFGECSGALVVERADMIKRPNVKPYVRLSGWGISVDGTRSPKPSVDGEVRAIEQAMGRAELASQMIDYVNPHGSGSPLGDAVEIQALKRCQLDGARINATKGILGHSLCAAGVIETIATILQITASQLHPCVNLEDPIDPGLGWVRERAERRTIRNALKLSFGFGGFNTAICLSRQL